MSKRNKKRLMIFWLFYFALFMKMGADALADETEFMENVENTEEIIQETESEASESMSEQSGPDIEKGTMSNARPASSMGCSRKTDTIKVTLPTNCDNTFDFIMDPQQLISGTDAAAYAGKVFEEDATIFFRRFDEESAEDYSSLSDALTVTNTGPMDVEIMMTASICLDAADGIVMTDDISFTDDMDTSFYLALTDGNVIVPVTDKEDASILVALTGDREWNGEYTSCSFRLLGAVNKNGDWSKTGHVSPKVTVTWDVVSINTGWLRKTMETEQYSEYETEKALTESNNIDSTEIEMTDITQETDNNHISDESSTAAIAEISTTENYSDENTISKEDTEQSEGKSEIVETEESERSKEEESQKAEETVEASEDMTLDEGKESSPSPRFLTKLFYFVKSVPYVLGI